MNLRSQLLREFQYNYIGELRLKRAPRVKRAPPLAAPSSGLVNVAYDTEHQTNMLNIHKRLHWRKFLAASGNDERFIVGDFLNFSVPINLFSARVVLNIFLGV